VHPNPSVGFAEIVVGLDPHLANLVSGRNVDPPQPSTLAGFRDIQLSQLDRADLLADLGAGSEAEEMYKLILWSRSGQPRSERLLALSRILRRRASSLRRNFVIRHILRGLVAGMGSLGKGGYLRRLTAEDIRTTDRWPTSDTLHRWLYDAEPRRKRAIGLTLVRRLRYEGRLRDATKLAQDLLEDSRGDNPNASHAASFSFQLMETLRMRGRMSRSIEMADLGVTRLASTTLSVWEDFERLACRVQRFECGDDILQDFYKLQKEFGAAQEPLAVETVLIARGVVHRLREEIPRSLELLEEARALVARRSPLLMSDIAFQIAETFRVAGDVEMARQHLRRMQREWFFHDAVWKLALVLIEPGYKRNEERLSDAYAQFRSGGSDWGMAVAVALSGGNLALPDSDKARAVSYFVREGVPPPEKDPRWSLVIL
jgi:hypothetical protein